MKRIIVSLVLATLGFLVMPVSFVSAQELRPDDRYNGYPQVLIEWPSGLPDLVACQAQEFYEPADFHLRKYVSRVKVFSTPRIQEFDECRWMLTRNKWRWVLRPAGTAHLVDAYGRDLFDDGSPGREGCENPSPFGFVAQAVEQFAPPPSPVARPPAIPAPRVSFYGGPTVFAPTLPRMVMPPSVESEPVVVTRDNKKGGFCSSKKCRRTLAAIGGGIAGGYATWYLWPCPPGTVRR